MSQPGTHMGDPTFVHELCKELQIAAPSGISVSESDGSILISVAGVPQIRLSTELDRVAGIAPEALIAMNALEALQDVVLLATKMPWPPPPDTTVDTTPGAEVRNGVLYTWYGCRDTPVMVLGTIALRSDRPVH
jgi:hypothetical protein